MKTRTIIILVIIVLAVLAYIYRDKLTSTLGFTKTLNGGEEPTQQDADCAGYSTQRAVENCTRPLFQKVGQAKEKAWVMETTDYPFDTCGGYKIKTPDGTVWWYNYQSGNKCIYINDNKYPAPQV